MHRQSGRRTFIPQPAHRTPTAKGMKMERDETTVKLERRIRRLTRVNRVLVAQRDRAVRDANRAAAEVDNVRDLMAERGLCDGCRRAIQAAARLELAA